MANPVWIDADGHVIERESMWLEYLEPEFHGRSFRRMQDDYGRSVLMVDDEVLPVGVATAPAKDAKPHANMTRPGGYDPVVRLKDMDVEGLTAAVLFPTNGFFITPVKDPRLADALCRAYNNWLFDYCKAAPKRLIGVGLVPRQDIDMACREARRCVEELGFRGIFVRPNPILGRTLHHPANDRLWETLQRLEVPACIHEGGTMPKHVPQAGGDRFDVHWQRHMMYHAHEQQMACLSMIGTGILERFPRLKVAFLESGCGWLAHWLERMDSHIESYAAEVRGLTMTPTEYFKRQCFVSVDPLEKTIPAIVELVGDDQLVWATDYPHPDAQPDGATRTFAKRSDLSERTRRKILTENPIRLYGLKGLGVPAKERPALAGTRK